MKTDLKLLEDRIVGWAMAHPAIRAAIIAGSTERQVNPADEWSDMDFELYVTDFGEFVANLEWLKQFGSLWTILQLQEDDGHVMLVLYENGQKVDFHFFLVDDLHRLVTTQILPDSCRRGYRIIVDKDNSASKLPPPVYDPLDYEKPSEDEFATQINAFWYGVVYIAKQIRRRNLWVVKSADWRIKQNLLKILEWHAQATHSEKIDTWHGGHFLSQWVDARTHAALQGVFGTYAIDSSWQALFATADLFHDLAVETGQRSGYRYPLDLEIKVMELVRSLRGADDLAIGE